MNELMKLIDTVEIDDVATSLNKVARVQQAIAGTLKSGQDFDTIPGTNKPTLLKPGAEKILMMFGLTSEYEIIESVEDWSKGVFAYTVRCILSKDGKKITEGLGNCNSKEDKYRYRWVYKNEVPLGIDPNTLKSNQYGKLRIENEEIYSQVNTILKMAKKRAQVDATLTVASLSEVFTQDMEDMKNFTQKEQVDNLSEEDARNFKVTFGKYKGQLLGEIFDKDTSYVTWLANNARDAILKQGAILLLNSGTTTTNEENDNTNSFFEEGTPFPEEELPFV
ncbi:MAG: hypothetical protein KHZ78_05330 [Peptoniphilus sp. oral taxon 375]|nr:hypothetical protein [Peptoniphilus sp. oral taxon 375]